MRPNRTCCRKSCRRVAACHHCPNTIVARAPDIEDLRCSTRVGTVSHRALCCSPRKSRRDAHIERRLLQKRPGQRHSNDRRMMWLRMYRVREKRRWRFHTPRATSCSECRCSTSHHNRSKCNPTFRSWCCRRDRCRRHGGIRRTSFATAHRRCADSNSLSEVLGQAVRFQEAPSSASDALVVCVLNRLWWAEQSPGDNSRSCQLAYRRL